MKWTSAAAAVAMVVMTVGAQGKRGPNKRELKFQVKPKGVVIQSESKIEGFKDKLTFKLDQNDNSMDATLGYKSQTDKVKADTDFDLRIFEIVEFTPKDAAKGFQSGDAVVSTYPNGKWDWAALGDDQGAETRTFTMGTTDGVFAFIAHVASAVNGTLEPNSIKFDIAITGFPYQGNGTQLALRTKLRTKDKFKDGKNGTQVRIQMTGGAPQGSLTWVSKADAGSSEVTVEATSGSGSTNATEKELYFAFLSTDQLEDIFWDPTIGVVYDDDVEDGAGDGDGAGGNGDLDDDDSAGSSAGAGLVVGLLALAAGARATA